MKKIVFSVFALCLVLVSFSQETSLKKKPSIGLSLFLKDFSTPATLIKYSLASTIENNRYDNLEKYPAGMGVHYFEGLTNNIDFMGSLYGSSVNYPYWHKTSLGKDALLIEADANLNYKFLTDDYTLVPFVSAGIGTSLLDGRYFGAYAPVGGGMQLKLAPGTFAIGQASYHLKVTDYTNFNFQYSIGLVTALKMTETPKKVVAAIPPPAPVVVEKDTDGDGIVDSKDKCPTVAGIAKYDGCPIPDTDGDGINDEEDKCPTVAGITKYQGCPIPDTDGDGVNDEVDKCPNVAGLARYQGCPIPDTDGDGVNDEEDKCPTEKGTAANNGCPELKDFNFEAKNVQFLPGSATLTKTAKAELDKGATILGEHTSLNILIEGYTDNTGKPETNKKLSQLRADAVKKYLETKGVAATRLTATGFGIASPIADNKTPKGRAENRRVEFKVKK